LSFEIVWQSRLRAQQEAAEPVPTRCIMSADLGEVVDEAGRRDGLGIPRRQARSRLAFEQPSS